MITIYGFIWLFFLCGFLWLAFTNKSYLLSWAKQRQKFLYSGLLLTFIYLILNNYLFIDARPVGDNWSYAFPFFNYLFQSFSVTGTPPFWNPYVNHGEPTFLFLNHNYLLHFPYILFYVLAPYLKGIDPYKIFWSAVLWSNYLTALGVAFSVWVLTRLQKVALFSFAVALFSGLSVGVLHQMQISASMLYIPWLLGFLLLWYQTEKRVYWYLSCWCLGYSLINHYPHLVIYFWGILGFSWLLLRRVEIPCLILKLRRLGPLHIFSGLTLSIFLALPTLWMFVEYSPQIISPYRGVSSQLNVDYNFLISSSTTNSFNPHTLFHYIFPQSFISVHKLGQARSDNLPFYIGILPLLFSIYGLCVQNSKISVIKMSVFLVLLLGMGAYSFGYFFLFTLIPFSSLQRIPLHFANYLNFLLILLSASGIKTFLQNKTANVDYKPHSIYKFGFLFFLSTLGLSFFYLSQVYSLTSIRLFLDDLILLFLMSGTFVWIWLNRGKKTIWIVLFSMLLFDLGRYYHLSSYLQKQQKIDTFYNLPSGNDYFNWHPILYQPEQFKTGSLYHALLLARPMISTKGLELVKFRNYQEFLDKNLDTNNKSGVNDLIKNRLYFIPKDTGELKDNNLLSILKEKAIIPKTKVLRAWPNELNIDIHENKKGLFIWMDRYDNGWSVEIDGKPAKIEPFGPFKSVKLTAHASNIKWVYSPRWRWVIYLEFILILLLPGSLFLHFRKL